MSKNEPKWKIETARYCVLTPDECQKCLRCGASEPMNYPLSFDAMAGKINGFLKRHRRCKGQASGDPK